MQKTKTVNITAQILATLFIPTGIYAFWRIGKQNKGSLIYILTGIFSLFSIGISYLYSPIVYYWDGPLGYISRYSSDSASHSFLLFFAVMTSIISILLPMYFINKWSKEYNKLKA